MSLPETLPLYFWGENQAEAEEQALAWAAAEPNIASATVESAEQHNPVTKRWTVVLRIDWRVAEQATLGLA